MKNSLMIRALGAVASLSLLQQPGLLLLPLAALKPQTAYAADEHAGHGHSLQAAEAPQKAQPKAAGKPVYQCPMHPQIVRDAPGTCPICYMELEKVDLEQLDAAPGAQASAAPAPGSKPKSAGKPVYQCPMHPQIVRDHPGTCPICYMDLEKVDLEQTEAAPQKEGVAGKASFRLSNERQQLIGVKVAKAAPAKLTRELRLAGRASGGAVLAQLQELDAGALKAGQQGWIVGPGQGTVKAVVSAIDTQLDAYTRSFAVRIQPSQQPAWLRGGIYVDVHIVAPVGSGLAVPRESVFDTGERKIAFVRKGDRFEPRELRLGAMGDKQVLVLEGVQEGEEVVIGANFLIDSEARFRAVAEQYR